MNVFKVRIPKENAGVLDKEEYSYCLSDDVYEWLTDNVGEELCDFEYFTDILKKGLNPNQWIWGEFKHFLVFVFGAKEKAMLFKLIWGGDL